jgi:oxalate decarboxylase/phosphoglucose isomerase-like protein (cupin superfamily)
MLYRDDGEGTSISKESFRGVGAEIVLVEPQQAHAVQNTGKEDLLIMAFSSESYEPSETVARNIV